jgi:HK97 family phage prohead protease
MGGWQTMNRETRYANGASEIRAAISEDGERQISGYAAVFEKDSQDLGGFVERIAKGAFRESIASNDVRALWSHNSDLVLGRTGNRTLKLAEDDYGLHFSLTLPDTTLGRDAFTSIERGDVTGMSFGFSVKRDDQVWARGEAGAPHLRTLMRVNLFEVSPTAFPAYPQTAVATRDLEWFLNQEGNTELEEERMRELERLEAWRPRI